MTQSSNPAALLSHQVQWKHPKIIQGCIDQTHLVISDAPTEPVPFSFTVIGDTDAGVGSKGVNSSFAQAFAQQMMEHLGESRFLLHTGDVTYPIGTYENYLNGFLQPYRMLMAEDPSTANYRANSIVFKRPLLPVPGNHDYAGLTGVSRLWNQFLRTICDGVRLTLGLDLGNYGGQGGEAYGQAFLDDLASLNSEQLGRHLAAHYGAAVSNGAMVSNEDTTKYSLSYQAGQFTRLPNRYYTFRYAGVDFFALDSNTWSSSPDDEGFDHEQLAWLERTLLQSWLTPGLVGRILYLHHSPYTTEITRWQQPETLWVRRNLRAVLDRVGDKLQQHSQSKCQCPLVDLVISGHAHCLEHVRTVDTGHADADMDWVVCGGSGAGVRRQRKADADIILENISFRGRNRPEMVAKSQFYAGIHGQASKRQAFHSFIRIDVQPSQGQKIKVYPLVVTQSRQGWHTKELDSLRLRTAVTAYTP